MRRAGRYLGPLGIRLCFVERFFGMVAFGDVLVGRDPATIRHRPVANLENAAVRQFDDGVVHLFSGDEVVAPPKVFVFGHGGKASRLEPQLDDLAQKRTWLYALRRQTVHVEVAPIAHDQSLLAIEEAKALRHVVEGGVEAVSNLARLRLLVQRRDLGGSRAPAFGEKLRPRCDQIHQIPVIGVHHPDQRHQQQAEIQSDADQHGFAGEHQPQRNRKRRYQQREPGGAWKASEAIGACDRTHEDEERDRSARIQINILKQRQRPDREARVERGGQDAGLEEMVESLFGGRHNGSQLHPIDHPEHAGEENSPRDAKARPPRKRRRQHVRNADTVDDQDAIENRDLGCQDTELLDQQCATRRRLGVAEIKPAPKGFQRFHRDDGFDHAARLSKRRQSPVNNLGKGELKI